jgi:hypothetical protein
MGSEYYAWRVVGKQAEVLLSVAVVERMQSGVLHAQLRDGDADGWGLLLGRSFNRKGARVTVVEDFEPLPVAPVRGQLRAPEGSRMKVVGVYRSAVGEAFRLDETDAAVIGRAFRDPAMVYLLVRPERGQASHGAFFVQEDGLVHGYASYLVFPFHAELLRERGPVEELTRPGGKNRALWTAAAVAAVVLTVGAWYGRPVARPSLPDPPPAPVLSEQGSADRAAPAREREVRSERPASKKRTRARVTPSKSASSLLVAAHDRPAEPSVSNSPLSGSSEKPNRFRRILSRVPGFGGLGR